MLIVCNGAFKSGSTWVEQVVRTLVEANEIPEQYKDKNLNRCLDIKKIDEFINQSLSGTYVTKSHVGNPGQIFSKQLVSKKPKVIMISRDPRDVLVSYYFHIKNSNGMSVSLPLFYYVFGRFKLCEIARYNQRWKMFTGSDVLWLDYESMITSFNSQLKIIAEYLGVELTEKKKKEIIQETSLEELKRRSKNPDFYRKGEVGDWANHISSKLTIKIVNEQNNPPFWVKIITLFLFDYRRKVFRGITFFRGV